ncbi:(E)-4-hydroxy-3-methylbut-2-enyl-diphosphate synthase [Aureibacter tunicatorum]|uniref:4-hydroxy-3-methylbut-2-en-1-yl diphosphate synthase (flavodoxin) n=1 Tax=Aureibacter tunicatorum TaxID=866807 RepID=A0AAE3XNI5_9BACT|nr:(E)-4-hydroxy-3-methylbut-2-enyl-diphosphate synthase [Aureibacter tunicatorum]MDR6239011.1 (E)-4-hydroxy-3-methylbut-2-enyl-diphosphate synthase [Aureibacter tunicatorum]BDD05063.1 4-hydroxy-3-methylbut-2-en-1-yl diphosphate synthase (flavodoxin) [Aureibacter tunicatorum]
MKNLNTSVLKGIYCNDLSNYSRRKSVEVNIGGIPLGGDQPIRVQSMTTADTMDTKATVEECVRMIESGCEYIRITAPSVKEAENLANIKAELRAKGYETPLVADIHFTPNAAEVAAKIVEKVRINPGNYVDKKKFQSLEYTDEEYSQELLRIKERFTPLVEICKEHGTAMRIGTNHGSLSDRIMSRYGDTPKGMVESALEFLRICDELDYHQVVISMKSSNPQVMVQAYRLLVNKMDEEGLRPYPLHLGVTEAGEGEDGRIKSAVGIGTLLEDGLGDTVRVSLTEDPEFESPVAQRLVSRYDNREDHKLVREITSSEYPIDPFNYQRRKTKEVVNFGEENVPRVIADYSSSEILEPKDLKPVGHHYLPELDKWKMSDLGVDYIYTGGRQVPFMLPNGLKRILNADIWLQGEEDLNSFPMWKSEEFVVASKVHKQLNFVIVDAKSIDGINNESQIYAGNNVVLVLLTENLHGAVEQRRFFAELLNKEIDVPVVLLRSYKVEDEEGFQLDASTDFGTLLIDGLGDGVLIQTDDIEKSRKEQIDQLSIVNSTAFGVLQAARTRITKTEYISCPSCGRTLFDLQETTAKIRKRTDHLKGVKIGIMGCIVNGPGEMADADFGYVGSGKGKITLYKGQEVVKRGVPSDHAVEELINIIKENGRWIEPETVED